MVLKGVEAITIAIVFSVLILTLLITPLITYINLRKHIIVTIKKEYEVNNAQLSLLTFLKKRTNLNDISSLLAEKDLPKFYEYYGIRKNELEKMFEKNLELLTASNFSLFKDGKKIVEKGETKDFVVSTFISLPYNPEKILSKIELVISE